MLIMCLFPWPRKGQKGSWTKRAKTVVLARDERLKISTSQAHRKETVLSANNSRILAT